MDRKRVGIIGGGPSALFMLRELAASQMPFLVTVFEKKTETGNGMPYSHEGALDEHITNVSGNEIPGLFISLTEWVKRLPDETLSRYGIDRNSFSPYHVLPRLLFGQYLSDQFAQAVKQLKESVTVYRGAEVTDIIDYPGTNETAVVAKGEKYFFDFVVVCTGHTWPQEESVPKGYYTSPYPPSKLLWRVNHPVAIRGASLTAIDAMKTIARQHGDFSRNSEGKLSYTPHPDVPAFRMVMFSRHGLLPAVRFHLDDPLFSKEGLLTPQEIAEHRYENDGFISLDFIFENDFKEVFRTKDPGFYEGIRGLTLEGFVDKMMTLRESVDPFDLLRAEYRQAEKSIRRHESVFWKEALATLSFAMNYPAKYFSAEDMLRMQRTLMPLISVVIAFLPQSSCDELFALHEAGILSVVAAGEDSEVVPHKEEGAVININGEEIHFRSFVDAIGQRHLPFGAFPFRSLAEARIIAPARLAFRSSEAAAEHASRYPGSTAELNGKYYLTVPGISINDHFQVTDSYGAAHSRIFMMAVPFIGGYNPDYSGLDFCAAASAVIMKAIAAVSSGSGPR